MTKGEAGATTRRVVLSALAGWVGAARLARAEGPPRQAEVEARVPCAPQAVRGSDGRLHVAYELHLTSFHGGGALRVTGLEVRAEGLAAALLSLEGAAVAGLLAEPTESRADGVPIEGGRRRILYLWVELPAGTEAGRLRHRLRFETDDGLVQVADGIHVDLRRGPPVALGPPLRGRWLAVEGPGDRRSHHWGGLTAINGRATIPQRFAIDWFGLDAAGRAVHVPSDAVARSTDADWVGFGADVLAVADGVVRDARDGIPAGTPLASQPDPGDLSARSLYGNFVILEVAPGVFVHYAHLRTDSVRPRAGDRVRRGMVIGAVGQTGAAGAPHLHLHVSDAPTFEESEGLPFTIAAFRLAGSARVEETLGFDKTVRLAPLPAAGARGPAAVRRHEMPLDGDVVDFVAG